MEADRLRGGGCLLSACNNKGVGLALFIHMCENYVNYVCNN